MKAIDLRLVGSIDQDSYRQFSEELSALEAERSQSQQNVELELYSEGGSSYAACAFAHRIRSSPLTVNVTVRGYFASAAILVVAACHHRRMAKNATAMVHEDQIEDMSGPLDVIEREVAHSRDCETSWCKQLAQYTKVRADVWAALHEETTYMDAETCLDYGLIDELV